MLHEALLVAARRAQVEQEKVATADLLNQLPVEVLREIAETGEIKLAYGMCSPDGEGGGSWVSQFKGTPFFQQAIALEQESLQSEMANQQANSLQNQKSQEQYALMDQVRLKKKLLELQKARNEAQVLDQGAGAPAAAGSPDPAGTAPGGPAGPPMEDLKTVTASLKLALSASTIGGYVKKVQDPARLAETSRKLTASGTALIGKGNAAAGVAKVNQANKVNQVMTKRISAAPPAMAKAAMDPQLMAKLKTTAGAPSLKGALTNVGTKASPMDVGRLQSAARKGQNGLDVKAKPAPYAVEKDPFPTMKAASVQTVEGWAKQMAQADSEKVAHAEQTFSIGDAAGRMMAKQAGAAEGLMALVKKHPGKALAVAGGLAGTAHGLLKEDGGLGEAAKEGITGAALGGALGHVGGKIHGHMSKGKGLGDAASSVKDELGAKVRGHYNNMKSTFDAGAKKVTDTVN